MIDIEHLRVINNGVLDNFKSRGFDFDILSFKNLDIKIRKIKTEISRLQHKHKVISFLFKELKQKYMKFDYLIDDIRLLKSILIEKKAYLETFEKQHKHFLLSIPNLLHKSVPFGNGSFDNIELRSFSNSLKFGESLVNDFECNNNYIDFELSAKLSGSGFVILKKSLAQLHRALGNYMLDLHIFEHGYEEIYSPLMVNEKSMFASGHFPKFYDDQFNIANTDLWLIPTSEVVLSNLISQTKIFEKDLPLRYISKTACFRKEKGSYGYKVKGLIRQHQFDKVELLHVVTPAKSYDALEELVYHAEKVLQNLNLPYRVLALCSKDLGFTASKTYDLEVWFPKRKMYVEVSSCSNTESFQSRRMNAKIKNIESNDMYYPHILNGSGLAIGRVLLSIVENYSDKNGNIIIPDVLVQYMNGKTLIEFK